MALQGIFLMNNLTFKINIDGMSLLMNNSIKHFSQTEQKKNDFIALIKGHIQQYIKKNPANTCAQSSTPSSVFGND